MALQTVRSRSPAGHAGLIGTFLALCADLATFFEARAALFVKESKAALMQMLILAACFLAAIMFFTFGYVFLIVSAVAGVAKLAQISWIWIALAAAGVHFLLVLICLLIARNRMKKRPYPELAAELKKDREWLKTLDVTSRPTN